MLISERIGEQTGYKSISWQEAQEDLLSAITLRNVLMYTIVGAILLVASFGTYNIISTITHEKTRDIAILKSLGFRDNTIRSIFIVEAVLVGLGRSHAWLDFWLSAHAGAGIAGIQDIHSPTTTIYRCSTQRSTICWPPASPWSRA